MYPRTIPAWTTSIDGAIYTVQPEGPENHYDVWLAAERLGSFDLIDGAARVPAEDKYFGRQVRAAAEAFLAASRDERA